MDDQSLVGKLNGFANLQEKLQTLPDVRMVLRAVSIEGDAFYVFHDEVRQALSGGAAVEHARDVGVVERRQDLPLVAKTENHRIAVHTAPDQFDGDQLAVLIVRAFGQVYRQLV